MDFQLTGRIDAILPTRQISEKFSVREMVLAFDEDTEYPQFRLFNFHYKKFDLADKLKVNQRVTVHFNMKGRKANNGNCYNTDEIWKVDIEGGNQSNHSAPAPNYVAAANNVADDDLPF